MYDSTSLKKTYLHWRLHWISQKSHIPNGVYNFERCVCCCCLHTNSCSTDVIRLRKYFGTLVNTQQWAQPVTAGVHVVSSRTCQLEAEE